jgi:hypothetical protein
MSAPWSSAGGSVVVMPYTYARDSVDVVSSMFSILLFLYLDVHISHMSWLVQLVQSVMWNPDGKVLLAGFNGTTSLAALHFAGRPPSLGEGDLAYCAYVGSLFELDGKTVTSNDQLCLAQCPVIPHQFQCCSTILLFGDIFCCGGQMYICCHWTCQTSRPLLEGLFSISLSPLHVA